MRCADCKHYEPARNPDTGRQLPSQAGDCVYPVAWPKLPKAFLPDRWTYYGSSMRVQFPMRQKMWRDNNSPCDTFEARPAKKVHAQMTLISSATQQETTP